MYVLCKDAMYCLEAKGRLPQDGLLWREYYFELKAIKPQQIKEKLFTSRLTAGLYQVNRFLFT